MNDKTKGAMSVDVFESTPAHDSITVDENLFYKGVDKSSVHGARLHQSHSLTDPTNVSVTSKAEDEIDACSPPYPFTV